MRVTTGISYPEAVRDALGDEGGHTAGERLACPEDDVATLDVGLHVIASRVSEHRCEILHWQLVFAANVDPTQERHVDAGRHGAPRERR